MPAGQLVQPVALAFEYVPAGHGTGSLVVLAQYEPAGQALHDVEPARLY